MRFSIPYHAEPLAPKFGPQTSKSNFCEEDFVVTAWIAEFANTLTNLAYVLYAIRGLRQNRQPFAARSMYVGLAFVGICSGLFHCFLKYWSQMADDLSMILASATVLNHAMTHGRTERFARVFTPALIALVIAETGYHTVMDEIKLHELSFVALIALVAVQTRALVKSRVSNKRDRSKLNWVIGLGAGCMIFGYVLWQIDFRYCAELTRLKRAVAMPWSFVFEFHGWWHILTAVGAYTFMALVESLTQEEVVISTRPFGPLVDLLQGGKTKQS